MHILPSVRLLLLASALASPAVAAEGDGFLPAESRVVALAQLPAPRPPAPSARSLRLTALGVPTALYGGHLFLLSERPQAPATDWALPPGAEPVRDFCWMDETGNVALLRETVLDFVQAGRTIRSVATPARGMLLTRADSNHCYLYGGEGAEAARTVLLIDDTGGVRHLAQLPAPVTAVAGNGANTFVAVGPVIYFLGTGAAPRAVFSEVTAIDELAYAPPVGVFYRTVQGVGCLHGPGTGALFLRRPGLSLDARAGRVLLLAADGDALLLAPINRLPAVLDAVRHVAPGRRP